MAEYIERESLLEGLRKSYNELKRIDGSLMYEHEHQICQAQMSTFAECAMRLKNAPAADVVEVRRGVWKDNHNGTFTCSVCGGQSSKMDWCGRCGAKMDGKGEGE